MVKVESVKCSDFVATTTSPHIVELPCCAVATIVKNDVRMKVTFSMIEGFKCDGASVPWIFSWFLPQWDTQWDSENAVYNVGSCIHDGLYANKGFGIFTREECDDILRGIWRESGISRFKAGVADKCIQWFAGGGKHWGNDSYGVKELFLMEIL